MEEAIYMMLDQRTRSKKYLPAYNSTFLMRGDEFPTKKQHRRFINNQRVTHS